MDWPTTPFYFLSRLYGSNFVLTPVRKRIGLRAGGFSFGGVGAPGR